MHTQGEEVAAESQDLNYISSRAGRSYSPSRKMHSLGETLPDTVSSIISLFYLYSIYVLKDLIKN